MVAQIGKCTRKHWHIHFKWMNFMICKLHFKKAVKKNKIKTQEIDQ